MKAKNTTVWSDPRRESLYNSKISPLITELYMTPESLEAISKEDMAAAEEAAAALEAMVGTEVTTRQERVFIANTVDKVKDLSLRWHAARAKKQQSAENERISNMRKYLDALQSLADCADFIDAHPRPDFPETWYKPAPMPDVKSMDEHALTAAASHARLNADSLDSPNGTMAKAKRYADAASKLAKHSKDIAATLDALTGKARESRESYGAILAAIDAERERRKAAAERERQESDPLLLIAGLQAQIDELREGMHDTSEDGTTD